MKLLTFIFSLIGLAVTLFIGSLLFTRYELLELSKNHRDLYTHTSGQLNMDQWIDKNNLALKQTRMTLHHLHDLSFMIYPSQKTAVIALVDQTQQLTTDYQDLINALALEADDSEGLKKIWELAFLGYSKTDKATTTQQLFADLPSLITNLQAHMDMIRSHQRISEEAQQVGEDLNALLKENHLLGKAFMLDWVFPIPEQALQLERLPELVEPSTQTPSQPTPTPLPNPFDLILPQLETAPTPEPKQPTVEQEEPQTPVMDLTPLKTAPESTQTPTQAEDTSTPVNNDVKPTEKPAAKPTPVTELEPKAADTPADDADDASTQPQRIDMPAIEMPNPTNLQEPTPPQETEKTTADEPVVNAPKPFSFSLFGV